MSVKHPSRQHLPCLPYPEKDMPEGVAIILPYAHEDHIVEFYNNEYDLIGVYDEINKVMLKDDAIAGRTGYFTEIDKSQLKLKIA